MTNTPIGFIGFGEVGHSLSKGLRSEGSLAVLAYDIDLKKPDRKHRVVARADDAGVGLCETIAELTEQCGMIFSAVVSSASIAVARSTAPHLNPAHVYIDLNSTSPQVKQEVGRIVEETGARFVEAAIMAAVPSFGHRVPILLCGAAAAETIGLLAPFGMSLENFGREIGRASATKMFRSIVVKGLEALLLECALAAERYGVTERVLASVGAGYPGIDWNKLAHFLLGRTAIHGDRRAHEMLEVAETLRALNIQPLMSDAAAERLLDAARLGLKSRFEDKPPKSYHDVVHAIQELQASTVLSQSSPTRISHRE